MGETTTTAEATTTVRGFKYLIGYNATGGRTTDPKRLKTIASYADKDCHWTVGEWKKLDDTEPILPCAHGFHMSPSPRRAGQFVSGNILALVEARGDASYATDGKSAHREMRILAWWPEDAYASVVRAGVTQEGYVPENVGAALIAANQAARDEYYGAKRVAQAAYDAVADPADRAYSAATAEPMRQRDLASSLASIRYERDEAVALRERSYAEQIAQAEYNAAVRTARAERDSRQGAAEAAFQAVAHPADKVRQAAVDPAYKVYRAANMAASDKYDKAKEAGRQAEREARKATESTIVDPIAAALGTPAAGTVS